MKEYHILNGDALKGQLEQLSGEKIVIRECLVEGNTKGDVLETFFENRIDFFSEAYGINEAEYRHKSELEISKILKIEPHSILNLWFENDLFCQVNLWFTMSALYKLETPCKIFLVSPIESSWKGFGGMSYESLLKSYKGKRRVSIQYQKIFSELWMSYQMSNWQELRRNSEQLKEVVDHIQDVVEAHIDRFSTEVENGRPQKVIKGIQKRLENPTFGKVFQEFCKLEGIYGFGDLQVRRIMDEMK